MRACADYDRLKFGDYWFAMIADFDIPLTYDNLEEAYASARRLSVERLALVTSYGLYGYAAQLVLCEAIPGTMGFSINPFFSMPMIIDPALSDAEWGIGAVGSKIKGGKSTHVLCGYCGGVSWAGLRNCAHCGAPLG